MWFFLDMNDANFWAVNKTRIGLLGSDRIGDRIGLIFALNSKLHWKWLLVGCCTTAKDSAKVERSENTSCGGIWRGHSLIENKWSLQLSYLAHSRAFLKRLLRKEAFNLDSVKNKTNSEESRDGKKHKISAMRDTHISPRHLRFGRCHVTKSLFGNCNRMKLCNRKFPSAVQLKIILCDDFQAAGEF